MTVSHLLLWHVRLQVQHVYLVLVSVFTPNPASNALAHSGKARLMESVLTCSKWEIAQVLKSQPLSLKMLMQV